MTTKIHIGISTCPNDTFAFHALLNQKIDTGDLQFEFELMDVEELNLRLLNGDFDVAKASFHAAILLADDLAVLSSGSALGFGVGPLLLSAKPNSKPSDPFYDQEGSVRSPVIACPGKHTTATLLYRLFQPDSGEIRQMIFSDIMPKLKEQEADFGVCIHEGRFTYRDEGLDCVVDLGRWWEEKTEKPLPLGGILVRKSLGKDTMRAVQKCVKASVQYGLDHPAETLPTMKRHAQEFSDDVLFQHVRTYVNDWTLSLGQLGKEALKVLADLAFNSGITSATQNRVELEIVD